MDLTKWTPADTHSNLETAGEKRRERELTRVLEEEITVLNVLKQGFSMIVPCLHFICCQNSEGYFINIYFRFLKTFKDIWGRILQSGQHLPNSGPIEIHDKNPMDFNRSRIKLMQWVLLKSHLYSTKQHSGRVYTRWRLCSHCVLSLTWVHIVWSGARSVLKLCSSQHGLALLTKRNVPGSHLPG